MKSDSQIKQDVLAELKWDAEIDESKIGVAVTNGAVTLTGHVPSYRQKMAAKRATKRVAGVLAVVDKTEVLLESEHHSTDEGLAERIANVLKWNVATPNNIKAEVRKGIVTLTGEVDWHYQRANILKNVEHVGGVIDVVNFINIKSALQRHADVEAAKIAVIVSNGTVTLSGTVDSMAEMDRVEDAVWAAPGVTKVVDNLRVV
jgi:osmotically-inducible protein OsmY